MQIGSMQKGSNIRHVRPIVNSKVKYGRMNDLSYYLEFEKKKIF